VTGTGISPNALAGSARMQEGCIGFSPAAGRQRRAIPAAYSARCGAWAGSARTSVGGFSGTTRST
jgi:hypothetical protein